MKKITTYAIVILIAAYALTAVLWQVGEAASTRLREAQVLFSTTGHDHSGGANGNATLLPNTVDVGGGYGVTGCSLDIDGNIQCDGNIDAAIGTFSDHVETPQVATGPHAITFTDNLGGSGQDAWALTGVDYFGMLEAGKQTVLLNSEANHANILFFPDAAPGTIVAQLGYNEAASEAVFVLGNDAQDIDPNVDIVDADGYNMLSIDTTNDITIGDPSNSYDLTVYGTISSDDLNSFAATSSGYFNWGATLGTTGYGFRDSAGTLQFKHSGGVWADVVMPGGTGVYVRKQGDTMSGPLIVDFDTATASVHIENTSGGNALFIDATGNTAATASLLVRTSNTSGTSKAIEVINHSSAEGYGIYVETALRHFRPSKFYITHGTSQRYAVDGTTKGDGAGIYGECFGATCNGKAIYGLNGSGGLGYAGYFRNLNGFNVTDTVRIHGISDGNNLQVYRAAGNGRGIYIFNSGGAAANTGNMLEVNGVGLGRRALFQNTTNTNASNVVEAITNGTGALYAGNNIGTGDLIKLTDNSAAAFSVGNTGVVWATGYSASGVSGIDDATQVICCTWEDDFTCSATDTIEFNEGLLTVNNCLP